MPEIYTNMQRLKRVPAEHGLAFTLETATERKKDNLLCNFCAWRDAHGSLKECSKHKVLTRYAKKGVGILVRTCNTYQPILTFRVTKKMEGGFEKEFNTFRLGATWYNRVSAGTVCGLYDVGKNKMFGKAVVTATHNGDMEEMCHEHAYKNHLFIGMDQEQAAIRMEAAMSKVYGHILKHRNSSICTVIDLNRIGIGDDGVTYPMLVTA